MQLVAVCFYVLVLAAVVWSIRVAVRGLVALTGRHTWREGAKTLTLGVVGAASACALAVLVMRAQGGDLTRIHWTPPSVFVAWAVVGFGWPHAALKLLRERDRAAAEVKENARRAAFKFVVLPLLLLYVGTYGAARLGRGIMHHTTQVDGYSHHCVAGVGYRWDQFRVPPFPDVAYLPLIYVEVALWYTFVPVGSPYP